MIGRPPRIAVVGSCNVDLTTFASRFPAPGETIFGDAFDLGFGGKGANQAAAARRCGADVQMVACLGRDLFGEATLRHLETAGIGAAHVRIVDGVSSGTAPIFVDPSGQNRIIVVKGANDCVGPEDVDRAAADLQGADCLVLQFEIPLDTVRYAIQFARAHGIRAIVNPAPAVPVDPAVLEGASYLVPNESEAEALAGMPVRTDDEAIDCATALLGYGIERVVVTLGARGAVLASREGAEVVPGFAVATRDTSGAGDAFIGSFATFLVEGGAERDAVRKANLYAALSTVDVGTQKSFRNRAEFEREWERRVRA